MPHILFICTANLYRSPLAAALFRRKLQADGQSHHWTVESAGTWTIPGQGVPPDALRAARSIDIDLKTHVTRPVDRPLLARQNLILVMERGHREALNIEFPFVQSRAYLLSEVTDQLEYDVADPAKSSVGINEFAAEMLKLIDRAYPNICQLVKASRLAES